MTSRQLRSAVRSFPRVDAYVYRNGLVRLRVRRTHETISDEVTCTFGEFAGFVTWLEDVVARGVNASAEPLPVPEYYHPRWNRDYRWTAAAEAEDEVWRRAKAPKKFTGPS
jgi:hypothetical protein